MDKKTDTKLLQRVSVQADTKSGRFAERILFKSKLSKNNQPLLDNDFSALRKKNSFK